MQHDICDCGWALWPPLPQSPGSVKCVRGCCGCHEGLLRSWGSVTVKSEQVWLVRAEVLQWACLIECLIPSLFPRFEFLQPWHQYNAYYEFKKQFFLQKEGGENAQVCVGRTVWFLRCVLIRLVYFTLAFRCNGCLAFTDLPFFPLSVLYLLKPLTTFTIHWWSFVQSRVLPTIVLEGRLLAAPLTTSLPANGPTLDS